IMPLSGSAQADSVVGQYFPPGFGAVEVLVFADVTQNSVTPLQGYWLMVTKAGLDPALQTHPNIQLVNDQTAMAAGAPKRSASQHCDRAHRHRHQHSWRF